MSDLQRNSENLFAALKKAGRVMATAESCTGGLIAKTMTDYAGSSDVLWGGFVTYSNDSKVKLLGVEEDILERFGAVSEETVRAMAEGAIRAGGADCSVSVSGIAGPGGGTAEKPVGTVWICAALKEGSVRAERFQFTGNRDDVREKTASEALEMLYKLISGN